MTETLNIPEGTDAFTQLLNATIRSYERAVQRVGLSGKTPVFYHTNFYGHKKGRALSRHLMMFSGMYDETKSLCGCSTCDNFISKYGDLAYMDEDGVYRWVLWDFELPKDHAFAVFFNSEKMNLNDVRLGAPLLLQDTKEEFVTLGTPENEDSSGNLWQHIHLTIPTEHYPLHYNKRTANAYVSGVEGYHRDRKEGLLNPDLLKRAISIFASKELPQSSYNERNLREVLRLVLLVDEDKNALARHIAEKMMVGHTYYALKNTAVGSFLKMLAEGGEADAKEHYVKIADSTKYMRASTDPKQEELLRAEQLIVDSGYGKSLHRRTQLRSEATDVVWTTKYKEEESVEDDESPFGHLKENASKEPHFIETRKTLDEFMAQIDRYHRIILAQKDSAMGVLTVQSNQDAPALFKTGMVAHSVFSRNGHLIACPLGEIDAVVKLPGMSDFKDGEYDGWFFSLNWKEPSALETHAIFAELTVNELRDARRALEYFSNNTPVKEKELVEDDHYMVGAVYMKEGYNQKGQTSQIYAYRYDDDLGEIIEQLTLV